MPCSWRRSVTLTPQEEALFDEVLDRLVRAGWKDDAPTKRHWLDFKTRLRSAIRKSPDHVADALSVCEFSTVATKEPGLDVALAIKALAASGQAFTPAGIRESSSEAVVSFELAGREFSVQVTSNGAANALNIVRVANEALSATSSPYRFHAFTGRNGQLLIAIARIDTIQRSLTEELLPSGVA